jgi:hypothetical protein
MGEKGGLGATGIQTKHTNHNLGYGQLHFSTRGTSGLSSRLIIDENGNVGSGTGADQSAANLEVVSTSGRGSIRLRGGATNQGYINYDNAGQFIALGNIDNTTDQLVVKNTGYVGIGTTDPGTKLTVNGYTQLGTDAPKIKIKKFTGTTAATQGGNASVAHGLGANKIISATLAINYNVNQWVGGGYAYNTGLEASLYWDATNIGMTNHGTNSSLILSKPFIITVMYEE